MECKNCDKYTPTFANPYPATPPLQITDFKYNNPLHLCRCAEALQLRTGADADYIVSQPYTVDFKLDGVDHQITVPEGMLTDLASVPSFARIFIGRVGPHLEASIVHDFLYVAWQDLPGQGANPADRKFADRLLLAGMEAAQVSRWKQVVVYLAVRFLGSSAYMEEDEKRYVEDVQEEPEN